MLQGCPLRDSLFFLPGRSLTGTLPHSGRAEGRMQSGLPGAPAGWTRKIPASSPYPAPDRLPQGKPVRHGDTIHTDNTLPYPYRLPPWMIPRNSPLQVLPFGLSPYRLRRSPATADAVRLRHLHPGDILAAGGVGRTTHEGCGDPATKTPRLGLGREDPEGLPHSPRSRSVIPPQAPHPNPKGSDPNSPKDKCKPSCFLHSTI